MSVVLTVFTNSTVTIKEGDPKIHLNSLVYYLSLLLLKAPFISEQFIYFMASTFKPNGSLSSTDEKQRKDELQKLKSESDFG